MKKIQITKGEHEPFYYFFDELLPEDEPYEVSDYFLERLLRVEKEFNECQRILETLYDQREVQDEE